jgi:hypothetical protein
MRPGYEKREDLGKRRDIAAELFGAIRWKSPTHGYARCPGEGTHSGKGGPRDFEVLLNGVPCCRCFHKSCVAIVEEAKKKLRSRIGKAECVRVSAPAGSAPRKRTFTLGRPTPFQRSARKEIRGIRVEEMLAGDVGEPKSNTSRMRHVYPKGVSINLSDISELGEKLETGVTVAGTTQAPAPLPSATKESFSCPPNAGGKAPVQNGHEVNS